MTIRVLIVDDSAFVRSALKRVLASDPGFEVTASAPNGRIALQALDEHEVDVVVLDVEMPIMGGIETLERIRETNRALPVVMFSTITTRGGAATLEALTKGASDYVTKPSDQENFETAFKAVHDELLPKLRSLVESRVARATQARTEPAPAPVSVPPAEATPAPAVRPPRRRDAAIDLVAIGVSTGGPSALATVLSGLPADLGVPVVVTQHMPPLFTRLLAERLDTMSSLQVREAADGDRLEAGCVHLAPGDFHLGLRRVDGHVLVQLDQGAPVNSCRPAVDVMLESVARLYGERTLVVILTGMGRDGLAGCRTLGALGAQVLAQDEATSVVWGMPGYVVKEGLADAVLPIEAIGERITRIARAHGRVTAHPA